MTSAFAVVKRHYPAIVGAGGLILIAMGVLFVTGEIEQLNIEAQKLTSGARARPLSHGLDGRCERRVVAADADLDRLADRLGLLDALAVALARADDPEAPGAELGSPTIGRPRISSQPSRSSSNGFIRTSDAG